MHVKLFFAVVHLFLNIFVTLLSILLLLLFCLPAAMTTTVCVYSLAEPGWWSIVSNGLVKYRP